ncbi:APC family permease [Lysinibacter cavernae]|uniref:Amino acid transporter n=1 Tax=Lysinibacter cavernae TaxID=1640652 RepID=A0A7X5TTJ1_9MICO|nr:APC family permease [Lysinibacter cavernae]NIH53333.1 amino acid transporter [Lysinibacter cavernae]
MHTQSPHEQSRRRALDEDTRTTKRWIIGEPLPSDKLEGQLLSKRLALPVFASDALSSVAYAPQELLMILLVGGLSFLTFAPWVAAAVVFLLIVVVVSFRQLVRAYPSGGGDYEVAHRNLGRRAGVVVASALLVDYVLTVAVSVASGVDNILSAVPELGPYRVEHAVGCVAALAAINLRGVRESSKAFAAPTYLFVASIGIMVAVGLIRTLAGDPPIAESAQYGVQAESLTQAGIVLLILRSFASGCSALTGVEAISNGIPAFKKPKVRNAQQTLVWMGAIAIALFVGLIAVALVSGVHYAEDACHLVGVATCESATQRSLIAQIASATFGNNSVLFYVVQATTAAVLLLAANTAFNGFPMLGAILARDSYAPKALNTRGDRLVYSNGMLVHSLSAIVLLVVFQARLTSLIQLYIIGVFVSFSLGQIGMVVHWLRALRKLRSRQSVRRVILGRLAINGLGAAMTASVLVVVTVTKFTHGAWIVFAIMPVLSLGMLAIHRYYGSVQRETRYGTVEAAAEEVASQPVGDHAIVLMGILQRPTVKALDYAIAADHASLEAVHVSIDAESTAALQTAWVDAGLSTPLRILPSPYRDVVTPLLRYLVTRRHEHPDEIVTVYLPQYIVGRWWENLLHNHRANRLRQKLLLVEGVSITLVPWLLESSSRLYRRAPRPLPGHERAGIPLRPGRKKS